MEKEILKKYDYANTYAFRKGFEEGYNKAKENEQNQLVIPSDESIEVTMNKQTAVDYFVKKLEWMRVNDLSEFYNEIEIAKQMEKEQQKSEQIELIKWIQDSLTTKEFYVTYDAEELLEKFKTK